MPTFEGGRQRPREACGPAPPPPRRYGGATPWEARAWRGGRAARSRPCFARGGRPPSSFVSLIAVLYAVDLQGQLARALGVGWLLPLVPLVFLLLLRCGRQRRCAALPLGGTLSFVSALSAVWGAAPRPSRCVLCGSPEHLGIAECGTPFCGSFRPSQQHSVVLHGLPPLSHEEVVRPVRASYSRNSSGYRGS
eukprot:TRINITY_DN88_c1_g1_i1.p2 TRINITY_DN88_c1_g1~~TRINITY_DN88_c1_g1_i1.p2  ORF type:complete len:193 (+),score=0.05 TRINITY_DN88_c1_g1_i1:414-992(+)